MTSNNNLSYQHNPRVFIPTLDQMSDQPSLSSDLNLNQARHLSRTHLLHIPVVNISAETIDVHVPEKMLVPTFFHQTSHVIETLYVIVRPLEPLLQLFTLRGGEQHVLKYEITLPPGCKTVWVMNRIWYSMDLVEFKHLNFEHMSKLRVCDSFVDLNYGPSVVCCRRTGHMFDAIHDSPSPSGIILGMAVVIIGVIYVAHRWGPDFGARNPKVE